MADPDVDLRKLKTLKEAAFCIGVHWRTLYRWTVEGYIDYYQNKINGRIYITDDEIKRILTPKETIKI